MSPVSIVVRYSSGSVIKVPIPPIIAPGSRIPPPDVSLAQNATTILFLNGMILLGPPTGGGCIPIQTACLEPQSPVGA